MRHLITTSILTLLATSCVNRQGPSVSAAHLAHFEGGGSLSTLWYYGADDQFHYFRHLWKSSSPYRIKRREFEWDSAIEFDGYTEGILVRDELSQYILKTQGIAVLDQTRPSDVFQILEIREKKDQHDQWMVDTFKGSIRIRKTRTDDKVHVPGGAVEFWDRNDNGEWRRALTG